MRLWVFRRAGRDHGFPKGSFNSAALLKRLPNLLKRIANDVPELLIYGHPAGGYQNEAEFVVWELFQKHTLRQGWGVPGLDLTKTKDDWIDEFIFAGWKYWQQVEINLHSSLSQILEGLQDYGRQASGRYDILLKMRRMFHENVVFVPNTFAPADDAGFTVCQIDGPYSFAAIPHAVPNTWTRDFGHFRPVKNIRSYRNGAATVERAFFAAYQRAINGPIEGPGGELLRKFLKAHYF